MMNEQKKLFLVVGVGVVLFLVFMYLGIRITRDGVLNPLETKNLSNDKKIISRDNLVYADSNGAIWEYPLNSNEPVKLLEGIGVNTLSFLSWTESGKQLVVSRCSKNCDPFNPEISIFISVIDFEVGITYENVFGPTTSIPDKVYWGSESQNPYIHLCQEGSPIKIYLKTGVSESLSDGAPCDNQATSLIPNSVLPKGTEREFMKPVPGQPTWYYESNIITRTFIYDLETRSIVTRFDEWMIECWINKDFFIASKLDSLDHARGIYKVFTDGTAQLLLPPVPEYSKEHLWRSPFCSSEPERLYVWEARKDSEGTFVNQLFSINTESGESRMIWSFEGFLGGGYFEYPIPATVDFVISIPSDMQGNGSLFILDGLSQQVKPLAGSLGGGTPTNGIGAVTFFAPENISRDGNWIAFNGITGSEHERTYLVQRNGNDLQVAGADRMAGTISCGTWSPSGAVLLCKCSDENGTNVHACLIEPQSKLEIEITEAAILTQTSVIWKPMEKNLIQIPHSIPTQFNTPVVNSSETPLTLPSESPTCPGALVPHLKGGEEVTVLVENWDKLKLRSEPVIADKTVIRDLNKYTKLQVIDGPRCVLSSYGNYWFWQVQVISTGEIGWVAEGNASYYFID